jgi:hypothetical protein
MLWLKCLGGLLILGTGGILAHAGAIAERRRLSVLDGWIDLIFYLRGQIDCYLTPLDCILAGADKALLDACMGSGKTRTLSSLLQASAPYLGAESQRALQAFLRGSGGYREEQLKCCDYCLDTLRPLREKLAAELPARIRLCVTLCLCVAFGTAILLW